jgi:23S rRNA (adenine2503-C2)-methyltransferase
VEIIEKLESVDGSTKKFLQKTSDDYIIETAYINDGEHFICYSSQIGCPVACGFCYNGVNKNFYRNLTKDEIINQCVNVINDLDIDNRGKPIKFGCMGVGEPLLNYENVLASTKELNSRYPNSIFSLATTGINSELILQLANEIKDFQKYILKISLHASNDDTRKKIIPVHRSMSELRDVANQYKKISSQELCWNYVLLNGVNDSEQNAKEFCDYLEEGDTVNLTHYSPIKDGFFRSSDNFSQFKKILDEKQINYYEFNPAGKDINAGCGQMAARYYSQLEKSK